MALPRSSMDSVHSNSGSETTTVIYNPVENREGFPSTPSCLSSQAYAFNDPIDNSFDHQGNDSWSDREVDESSSVFSTDLETYEETQGRLGIKEMEGSEPSERFASAELKSYAQSMHLWHILSHEEQHWFLQLVTSGVDENDCTEAFQREVLLSYLAGLSHGLHYCADGYLEDRITIECPNNTNIGCRPYNTDEPTMVRLVMARSQLMHSGWFVKWFNSPHYLARAGMKITWPNDPIACWEMAKSYMAEGYDRFGYNQITAYVCTNFHLADRFIVLVRLYKLACVLDLFGLMDAAFAVLTQMEHLIAPSNVVTLARYMFGGEKYCENISNLRKRCLKWIGKHYDWLAGSEQWAKVIENSVPELKEQWMRITSLKKMLSQEELRMAIQQNISDANAIINAANAVDSKSEMLAEGESDIRREPSRRSVTPKKEYTFTKLERSGSSTPTNEQLTVKNVVDLPKIQLVLPSDDPNVSKSDIEGKLKVLSSIPRKSSFQEVLEAEDGNACKNDGASKDKQLTTIARKPSFQEIFEDDLKRGKNYEQMCRGSAFERKNDLNGPVFGALTASISEPLLTSRRHGQIYDDSVGTAIEHQDYVFGRAVPDTDSDDITLKHEDDSFVTPRGVVLTPEALYEPDRWPLADIPLPDPLLPLARRGPSLDPGRARHEKHNATIHQAQAVTVFGVHRPGMGGSIVPVNENSTLRDSRAGSANEAKAREFLGINRPGTVGVVKSGSRSSLDAEMGKLKKRTAWLG